MSELRVTNNDAEWSPKHYAPLVGLFCALYMTTQALASKIADFHGLYVSVAIIIFPLCAIITDLLTEVYGFNRARKALWTVLGCTALQALFTVAAVNIPAAPFWDNQEAYASVFALAPRIALAGGLAWIVGELVNSFIMSKMKLLQNAHGTALRFIGSTVVGQLLDTIVFLGVGFWGVFTPEQLFSMLLVQWGAKVLYEVVALPLTVPLSKWLKRLEGVEHFDRQKISAI